MGQLAPHVSVPAIGVHRIWSPRLIRVQKKVISAEKTLRQNDARLSHCDRDRRKRQAVDRLRPVATAGQQNYFIEDVTKSLASSGKVNRINSPSSRSKGIGPSRTDSMRATGLSVFNRNSMRSSG